MFGLLIRVLLALQSTQEGQMPGLIAEVLLPAFEKLSLVKTPSA
jgi:hypothetical protein